MRPNATSGNGVSGKSGRNQRRHDLGDRALAGRGPRRDPRRVARPRRRAGVPHAGRHGGARGTGRSPRPLRAATTSTACWSPRRSSRGSPSSPATPCSAGSRCRPSRCSSRRWSEPSASPRSRPRPSSSTSRRASRRPARSWPTPPRRGRSWPCLPECFLSIYPTSAWAGGIVGDGDAASAIWERMWESSVAVDGPEVARLVAECRERNLICASASTSASPTAPAARSTTRCCCSAPTASSTATAS